MNNIYEPKPKEKLGPYLKRLRQLSGKSLESVADESQKHSPSFTSVWLSKVENGKYKEVGGERLRTLATIYSNSLGITIPNEWLLSLAGYTVEQPATPTSEEALLQLLKNDSVRALLIVVAKLVELGHPEDVQFLATTAQRLIKAHTPDLEVEDIYSDPTLSEHVRKFMEEMGL